LARSRRFGHISAIAMAYPRLRQHLYHNHKHKSSNLRGTTAIVKPWASPPAWYGTLPSHCAAAILTNSPARRHNPHLNPPLPNPEPPHPQPDPPIRPPPPTRPPPHKHRRAATTTTPTRRARSQSRALGDREGPVEQRARVWRETTAEDGLGGCGRADGGGREPGMAESFCGREGGGGDCG